MTRYLIAAAAVLLAVQAQAATVTLQWQDNSSGLNQEAEFIVERHLARPVPGQVQTELDPSDTWGSQAQQDDSDGFHVERSEQPDRPDPDELNGLDDFRKCDGPQFGRLLRRKGT